MTATYRPPGHYSKPEAAAMVGVCPRTLDRRRKLEGVLPRELKAGRGIWFPREDVEAYVKMTRDRGYV